jgi:hypothetical protein
MEVSESENLMVDTFKRRQDIEELVMKYQQSKDDTFLYQVQYLFDDFLQRLYKTKNVTESKAFAVLKTCAGQFNPDHGYSFESYFKNTVVR